MKRLISFFLNTKNNKDAFILPLTLVIISIILAVSTGVTLVLLKELYFSQITRQSTTAYYAADEGVYCTTFIDDAYTDPASGLGIFPYDKNTDPNAYIASVVAASNAVRTARGLQTISSRSDIICDTFSPFGATSSPSYRNYSRTKADGTTEDGKTTDFSMQITLSPGNYRCGQVTVNKTATFRQIISRGFTTCATTSPHFVERAVINTTEKN